MKKKYIEPQLMVVKIQMEQMLATSLQKDSFGGGSGNGDGAVVSSRRYNNWDVEDEEDEDY